MTAEQILEKHLLLMLKRTDQSYVSVDEMKQQPEWQATINAMLEYGEMQALRINDVSGMLPTDEELDNAAIDFVNGHCDNLSGDLTQETECFDAGAVWMRERLLGNYR
jgi:hypothetical protein